MRHVYLNLDVPDLPTPGEWQTDKKGRRFRKVGGVIEYEMEVHTSGAVVPQSQLAAHTAQMEKDKRRRFEEERKKEAEAIKVNCPLAGGIQTTCIGEACALFLNGCVLAQLTGRQPAKDTQGLICPLGQYKTKCRTDCALYRNGCALISIIKNSEREGD